MFFVNRGLVNLNYFQENVHERTVRIFGDEEDPEEHFKKLKHNNIKSMKIIIFSHIFITRVQKALINKHQIIYTF